MRPFEIRWAADVREAVGVAEEGGRTAFLAGGTGLVDLMKLGVETPSRVVDITGLPFDAVEERRDAVRIGALARLRDVAASPIVRRECPAVSASLLASASPQVRTMATMGGNLLQRTRCSYFRDVGFPCNKRSPGSGCAAIDGANAHHAILGTSDACIAVHPSDVAVALVALEATAIVAGPGGEHAVPVEDLYREPGDTPQVDTVLGPAELVVAIDVPRSAVARRSRYLKVRNRASFEFALTSVAASIEADATVTAARLALGGVATRPWRVRDAEQALVGAAPDRAAFEAAARAAVRGARTTEQNAYRVELTRRAVVRALTAALGVT